VANSKTKLKQILALNGKSPWHFGVECPLLEQKYARVGLHPNFVPTERTRIVVCYGPTPVYTVPITEPLELFKWLQSSEVKLHFDGALEDVLSKKAVLHFERKGLPFRLDAEWANPTLELNLYDTSE
jgi:hypothetical protein